MSYSMTWPHSFRLSLQRGARFRRGIGLVSGAAGAWGETCLGKPFTTICIGAAVASWLTTAAGRCGESNRWLLALFLLWPRARSSTELKALEIISTGSPLPPRLLGLRTLKLEARLKPGVEFLI